MATHATANGLSGVIGAEWYSCILEAARRGEVNWLANRFSKFPQYSGLSGAILVLGAKVGTPRELRVMLEAARRPRSLRLLASRPLADIGDNGRRLAGFTVSQFFSEMIDEILRRVYGEAKMREIKSKAWPSHEELA